MTFSQTSIAGKETDYDPTPLNKDSDNGMTDQNNFFH